jgi:starch synthase
MRILIAVSELYPFSKTGGLADMVSAMVKTLSRRGHEVTVVTPLYKGIYEKYNKSLTPIAKLSIPLGSQEKNCELIKMELIPNLQVVFVKQSNFYERDGLYQENGNDYPDNAARFIFFSKCVVEMVKIQSPDIVHIHDWQVGLVPLFIYDLIQKNVLPQKLKTLLTIHNIAYQGIFSKDAYSLTNLKWDYFKTDGAEFYGNLNCLKTGIIFSHKIITVSPRYAIEIMTPEFGCGLDGVLRWKRNSLIGILNGVDYEEWNTENNPYLYASYSIKRISGKNICKKMLQRECKINEDLTIPLFSTISRLTDQKGIDILIDALKTVLETHNLQFVLLGQGEKRFKEAFENLAKIFPDKVVVFIGFDQPLSHRIESGSDFFVMPSKFEPCGLNQMYSLKYGTIPIVRRTGGLDDSVIDMTDNKDVANGIKFTEYTPAALIRAIQKAITIFENKPLLKFYRTNGMKADFSWNKSILEYEKVYNSLINGGR